MFKTRKLICHVIMVAMILALAVPVFADSNSGPSERELGSVGINFSRLSNTSAKSIVSATYFSVCSSAKVTLTLQEYKNGSWVTASGVSPVTQTTIQKNTASLYVIDQWKLLSGKSYRLKLVSTDVMDGNTYTHTTYSNSI